MRCCMTIITDWNVIHLFGRSTPKHPKRDGQIQTVLFMLWLGFYPSFVFESYYIRLKQWTETEGFSCPHDHGHSASTASKKAFHGRSKDFLKHANYFRWLDKELESALVFPVSNGLLQISFCYIGDGQRGARKFPFNLGV